MNRTTFRQSNSPDSLLAIQAVPQVPGMGFVASGSVAKQVLMDVAVAAAIPALAAAVFLISSQHESAFFINLSKQLLAGGFVLP